MTSIGEVRNEMVAERIRDAGDVCHRLRSNPLPRTIAPMAEEHHALGYAAGCIAMERCFPQDQRLSLFRRGTDRGRDDVHSSRRVTLAARQQAGSICMNEAKNQRSAGASER